MEKKNLNYESPVIDIVEVEVEQCFATSNQDMDPVDWIS